MALQNPEFQAQRPDGRFVPSLGEPSLASSDSQFANRECESSIPFDEMDEGGRHLFAIGLHAARVVSALLQRNEIDRLSSSVVVGAPCPPEVIAISLERMK